MLFCHNVDLTEIEGNIRRPKRNGQRRGNGKWSTSSLILVPIFIKKTKWLALKLCRFKADTTLFLVDRITRGKVD